MKDGTVAVTHYWLALFENPGGTPRRRSRYFSIARRGEEEAKRLAIEQRRAWEREAGEQDKLRGPSQGA